jgi:hypothetical protein
MWRNRADGRPADSIKQFHRHLRVLNGTEPHGYSRALTAQAGTAVITAPMAYRGSRRSSAELRRRRTIERRRNVLFSLVGASVFTLFLAIAGVGHMVLLNALSDAMLAGYIGVLVYLRSNALERDVKVRYLPQHIAAQTVGGTFSDEVTAWGDLGGNVRTLAAAR